MINNEGGKRGSREKPRRMRPGKEMLFFISSFFPMISVSYDYDGTVVVDDDDDDDDGDGDDDDDDDDDDGDEMMCYG